MSFRVLLAVAAQLLVLAWMAGEREWILRTGQVVYLRTAPIDPRDLFRGDVRYDCYIAVIRGGVFRCHSPCKIKQYSSCVNSP